MDRPNEELMRHYGTDVDFLEKEARGGISPFAQRMLFAMLAMKMQRGMGDQMNHQREQAMALNDQFQQLQLRKLGPSFEGLQHSTPPVFADPGGAVGQVPYSVPLGMDTGMVRVATALGAELARMDKEAGIMSGLAGLAERKAPALAKGFGQVGSALQAPVRGAVAAAASPMGQKVVGGLQKAQQAIAPVASKALEGAKSVGRGALTAGALGVGAAGLGAYALAKPALGYLSKEQQPTNMGMADYGAPQLPYGTNQYGQPQLGTPFMR